MSNPYPPIRSDFAKPDKQPGQARADFVGLVINLIKSAHQWSQHNAAKQGVRKALNDAIYSLEHCPEGHFVLVHMVARDIGAGAHRGTYQFVRASVTNPEPVSGYYARQWVEAPGSIVKDQVVHNVRGKCPANLPSNAMNVAQARALKSRL
jgi:hypothetical protein